MSKQAPRCQGEVSHCQSVCPTSARPKRPTADLPARLASLPARLLSAHWLPCGCLAPCTTAQPTQGDVQPGLPTPCAAAEARPRPLPTHCAVRSRLLQRLHNGSRVRARLQTARTTRWEVQSRLQTACTTRCAVQSRLQTAYTTRCEVRSHLQKAGTTAWQVTRHVPGDCTYVDAARGTPCPPKQRVVQALISPQPKPATLRR